MPGAFTGIVASSRVSTFNPASISGLLVWFKADSLSLADGTPVTSWPDSSSNANNATASGAQCPIFKTGIINGKPVLRFDGTDDVMYFGGATVTYGTAFFVYVKVGIYAIMFGYTAVGASGLLCFNDGNCYWINADPEFLNVHVGYDTAWHLDTYRRAAGSFSVYRDGISYLDGVPNADPTGLNMIGARIAGEHLQGDIAEILLYDSALGSTDRVNVENYLTSKYSL